MSVELFGEFGFIEGSSSSDLNSSGDFSDSLLFIFIPPASTTMLIPGWCPVSLQSLVVFQPKILVFIH